MFQHKQISSPRKDVYQEITDYVIEALEKGVAIWQKPWGKTKGQPMAGFPQNLTTQKHYKGWNHFYLQWICLTQDFESPYFLTFKQAQALGGSITKGSKGFPIVKWLIREKERVTLNTQTGQDEITVDLRFTPITYTVFNVAQTSDIEYPDTQVPILSTETRIQHSEQIVTSMPNAPLIREGGDKAYYIRLFDQIQVPAIGDFKAPEEYYSTLFHEMIHSTGHEKRLNRNELIETDGYGGQNYSLEELTAEMGAAYLCGVAGIEQKTIDNSTAYLQGWLKKLESDKKLILKAATKAQAAADFILNENPSGRELHEDTTGDNSIAQPQTRTLVL